MSDKHTVPVRVWDAPTRLFHWALAICTIAAIVTGQTGDMDLHVKLGYAICTLLLFRLIWGLIGGHWSRFSSFLYHPREVLAYLQGRANHGIGHNPIGALSVFAMLSIILLQFASGLLSSDQVMVDGLLVQFVSASWVDTATHYHAVIGKYIVLVLIGLHVLAIILYRLLKHENLLLPMISGNKKLDHAAISSQDNAASRLKAIIVFILCLALVQTLVAWLD